MTIDECMAAISAEEAEAAARRARKPSRADKHAFYSSAAWRRLRYRTLRANAQRNGGVLRCEVCGRGKAEGVCCFHCDHVEPISKNWARRLDPTNVQVACEDCNVGKSNTDSIDWRPAA
jgi:5-methylcytosine-specific restriction endonuclease McrA